MSLWSELILAEHVYVHEVATSTSDEVAAALLMAQDIAPEVQGQLLVRAVDGLGEPIAVVIRDSAGVSHIVCAWNRLGDRADQASLLAALEQATGTATQPRVMLHQPRLGSRQMNSWLGRHGYVETAGGVWVLHAQGDDLDLSVWRYSVARAQHTMLAA